MNVWRFWHTGYGEPAANMATDEGLLRDFQVGCSRPVLRTYGWRPPAISLGYFQRESELQNLPPNLRQIAIVRRPTGGGAIYHDQELTYALVLGERDWPKAEDKNALYRAVHRAIIAMLGRFGIPACLAEEDPMWRNFDPGSRRSAAPFFCFARHAPFDVLVGGRKIAGSAQRRVRGVVLQHGSILLRAKLEAGQEVGLADLCGAEITLEDAAERLRREMERVFGVVLLKDAT